MANTAYCTFKYLTLWLHHSEAVHIDMTLHSVISIAFGLFALYVYIVWQDALLCKINVLVLNLLYGENSGRWSLDSRKENGGLF